MVSGMIEGVVKQMINKFPGVNADDLITTMRKQPTAGQLFGMMNKIGLTEDKFKKMIDAEIIRRQKL